MVNIDGDGARTWPGTYFAGFKCKDRVVLSDGNYVDHDCADNTPYYTDTGSGSPGESNGTTKNATMMDAPTTGGGDKGFNSPSNPTGWKKVVYNFQVHAICA